MEPPIKDTPKEDKPLVMAAMLEDRMYLIYGELPSNIASEKMHAKTSIYCILIGSGYSCSGELTPELARQICTECAE